SQGLDTTASQGAEQVPRRREVQIAEESQAGPEVAILRSQGLFDLDDELGLSPNTRRRAQEFRARVAVIGIGVSGGDARAPLDQHPMARAAQGFHGFGKQGDPSL